MTAGIEVQVRLGHHARHRMAEWGFCEQQVLNTIRWADKTWPGRYGCIEYVGNDLIATVAPDGTVVTVKLVSPEPYSHRPGQSFEARPLWLVGRRRASQLPGARFSGRAGTPNGGQH